MKKIYILISLFFLAVTPFVGVKANESSNIEIPQTVIKDVPVLQNGPINESASFANIVIFIKFADESSYSAPFNYEYYNNLFNDENNESLKNYYQEVSYGQLTIVSYIANDGTTMVFYEDVNNRAYYQPYDEITNSIGYNGISEHSDREHAMLKGAIDYIELNNLIDDSINLDVNDDGDIDSITFMLSGEDDGWNTLFWPHKWVMSSYYNYGTGNYDIDAPVINGKYAYTYTFELLGNSVNYEMKVDVGVLAHETFHLISAPDLYHYYAYQFIEPVGDWGLMDNTSVIPSHMLGYMKEEYGNWITSVDMITSSGTYTLGPLADSASNLYKIDLGYSNEYVYIEYRLQEGFYESNLPDSGLIVYRVDQDFYTDGNVDGYYDYNGIAVDELFIFRPGLAVTPPITFPEVDRQSKDEDGDLDNAALSNNNPYDEMGNGTDIVMFYSDGSLMDIKIFNVIEHDGVITFDLYLPPRIELVSEVDIPTDTILYLLDADGFEYRVTLSNIPLGASVYYTLDGTIANETSAEYIGGNINFTAVDNIINVSFYVDGILISNITEEYNFVSIIETSHNPYGDYQDITWYLDLEDDTLTYDLSFTSTSFLEADYDYLYVTTTFGTTSYTGNELGNLGINDVQDIVIHFTSDADVDEYYGFLVDVLLTVDIAIDINGLENMIIQVNGTYLEGGASLIGANASLFTLETTSNVDTSTLGTYYVVYNALDEFNNIVKTDTRTVNVVDSTSPVVTIIGQDNIIIDLNSNYIEYEATYTDNYDSSLDYNISGTVNTSLVGEYTITYTVIDSSGNVGTATRIVTVIDNESPIVVLETGIDTVYVGTIHFLASVTVTDNYYNSFIIEVDEDIDVNTVGTYIVTYTVTDGSGNVSIVYRYVNVVEEELILLFVLTATVTTIKIGDNYNPGTCTASVLNNSTQFTCQVSYSNVNTNIVGTYLVSYFVEYNGIKYEIKSYVFVYDDQDLYNSEFDLCRRDYL
ncbi:MAG: M6 family metalloprotease domain-containing protein [Candidatus Izemoplasma sp.]